MQQFDCIGREKEPIGTVALHRTRPGRDKLAVGPVEPGQVGGGIRHGGAEEEAEPAAVALAAQRGNRRVDLWRSHPSDDVSVCVKLVRHRRVVRRGQEGGPRRRNAGHHPPLEPIDRGIECPVRSTGVDRNGAIEPTHGRARRVLHGSQVPYGALSVAGVVGADGEAVVVVVRTACDLPQSEPLGIAVVQPVSQLAVVDIGLGLELEDRNAEVTADGRRVRGRVIGLRCLGKWSARTELAVHEEPLVDACNRLNRIDVRHEADG